MKIQRARWAAAALSAAIAMGMCGAAIAQPDTWMFKSPMPTARFALSAVAEGGVVYALGGTTGNCNDLATVEAYDIASDTWSSRKPMPTARSHLGTAFVGGVLYAIGGTNFCGNHYAVVEAYDPATDTWSPRAPMPAPRVQVRPVVIDGKIYASGGKGPGHVTASTTFVYDPASDTWSTLADTPTGRATHAAGAIGQTMYMMGGDEGQTTVDAFHAPSNTWSVLPIPFGPRAYVDAETIGGLLYIAGGTGANDRLDRFDGSAFTPLTPLPSGRGEHATATAEGKLFVVGGIGPSGTTNSLLAYAPAAANTPPVANAGDDRSVAAGGSCNADLVLDGTGSHDPDGDALSYAWSGAFGTATGATPSVVFPIGTHTATLVVGDGKGGTATDSVQVTVADTQAPSIAASATPAVLWPPSHELVPIEIAIAAPDNCGASRCRIVAVASNEPIRGPGSGNTAFDWMITGDLGLAVRSERSGTGAGRIYTVTLECTDNAGNSRTADVAVSVPHAAP